MKILLFYFSGAGYTRWVVNRLSGVLIEKGHSVHLEAVENCDMAGVLQREDMIDAIGFAQPIYAADIPRIMRRAAGGSWLSSTADRRVFCKYLCLCQRQRISGSEKAV